MDSASVAVTNREPLQLLLTSDDSERVLPEGLGLRALDISCRAQLPEPSLMLLRVLRVEDKLARRIHAVDLYAEGVTASLRIRLIYCLTSIDHTLKTTAGEFLLAVCDGDSQEFVRLCGLGSAAGLVQQKDMMSMFSNLATGGGA